VLPPRQAVDGAGKDLLKILRRPWGAAGGGLCPDLVDREQVFIQRIGNVQTELITGLSALGSQATTSRSKVVVTSAPPLTENVTSTVM